jgi:hypothetical protein
VSTRPVTIEGAIEQLEFAAEWDDPDIVATGVAGLGTLAAGGAA